MVQKAGYKLLVLHSSESYEREIENVRICLENGVDGLFISLTNETKDLSHLDELKEAGIPVLLVDKVLDSKDYDGITIDDKQATQICIEHLIHTGSKRILGLFGNQNLLITHNRLAGFVELINKHKHICACHYFVGDTFTTWALVEEIYPTFMPDAIFAMSDEIIAGVIPALRKMKVAIPDKCSVIGISDGYLPKILDPQVTFLHHNGLALGRLAATHLIDTIKQPNKQNTAHQLILPTELIIGNSTKS